MVALPSWANVIVDDSQVDVRLSATVAVQRPVCRSASMSATEPLDANVPGRS